jgi:ankyrin repeat protein
MDPRGRNRTETIPNTLASSCAQFWAGPCLLAWLSVAMLTAAGTDTNEARLLDAAKTGRFDIVRTLVKQRVGVDAQAADGTTALHWAVRAGDLETVRLLLRAGANVKTANRYGMTALWLAATNGDTALIATLLDAGAEPDATLPEGETSLMAAARVGATEVVRVLAAHGANVNAQEHWLGETALMWAVAENHHDTAKALIALGADVDARSTRSAFPHASPAAENLITMTFPQGAWTPLMYAARQGALESVRVLAEGRASLNLTNPDGTTATVLAIINGHYDVAHLLLELGADPNVADLAGMAALYAAIDMRTLPWMQGRPAPKPSGQLSPLDVIRTLLTRGADPNARLTKPLLQRQHTVGDRVLDEGTTPFIRAARFGDVTVMRLLLEHGANPHLTQKNHTTALMMAASLGTDHATDEFFDDKGTEDDAVEAIGLCLAQGLDINAFNDNGDTALHRASGETIVRFLVVHGAELGVKNKQRKTPLDVAVDRKDRNGGIRYPQAVAALRELSALTPPSETQSFPR